MGAGWLCFDRTAGIICYYEQIYRNIDFYIYECDVDADYDLHCLLMGA